MHLLLSTCRTFILYPVGIHLAYLKAFITHKPDMIQTWILQQLTSHNELWKAVESLAYKTWVIKLASILYTLATNTSNITTICRKVCRTPHMIVTYYILCHHGELSNDLLCHCACPPFHGPCNARLPIQGSCELWQRCMWLSHPVWRGCSIPEILHLNYLISVTWA